MNSKLGPKRDSESSLLKKAASKRTHDISYWFILPVLDTYFRRAKWKRNSLLLIKLQLRRFQFKCSLRNLNSCTYIKTLFKFRKSIGSFRFPPSPTADYSPPPPPNESVAAATSVFTEYVFCESVDSAHNSQISSTFQEADCLLKLN